MRYLPVAMLYIIAPILNMSTFSLYGYELKISGATNPGVPHLDLFVNSPSF